LLLSLLVGCATSPKADFTITRTPAGPPIAGFGACMNPYLYAYPNMPAEISPSAVADLEAKVKALHPQFVRIFFLNSWWEDDTDPSIAKNHPGMRESLIRTIRLAQESGASVLLQFWYDPKRYEDHVGVTRRFARAIAELRQKHGLTAIRYATIQNEPDENADDVTMSRYIRIYRAFDRALRELNLRDDIKIIGGDLVGEYQHHWLAMLGRELSPVLDGYSIHAYWDYWDISKFRRHLKDTVALVEKLPPSQRRPLYVTEFGARGFREHPSIEPGQSDTGKPVADVPVYSFEIAIFLLDAINAGFVGTAQWDLYDAWYDRKMGYGLIGKVQDGFPLKPGYDLLNLFTYNTAPGWRALKVSGRVEDIWVAALRARSSDAMSVFILNRIKGEKQVTVGGLPARRVLTVWRWNADGSGRTVAADSIAADQHGMVTVTVPEMSIAVLTTLAVDDVRGPVTSDGRTGWR
jgi:hypothetical protein